MVCRRWIFCSIRCAQRDFFLSQLVEKPQGQHKDKRGVDLIFDVLPFVGRKCEQIHETGLVEIAHRGIRRLAEPIRDVVSGCPIALVILMTTALSFRLIEVRVLGVCGA